MAQKAPNDKGEGTMNNKTFTVVYNLGWWEHEDCRNAYSVHDADCKFVKTRNNYNCQGVYGNHDSVEIAIEDAYDEALGRFADAVKEFGFWHMIKVCKCAGGAAVKKEVKNSGKVAA
jgi:hypothetical protein